METWLIYSIIGAITLIFILLIRGWIIIYNKFQYWYNKALEKFDNIETIMQKRLDSFGTFAQITKKYDIHENKTFKEVIEARSKWSKDLALNEKVKLTSQLENNFIKLHAVAESYPELKAVLLHHDFMSKVSHKPIEDQLSRRREEYNEVVRKYNTRLAQFPRNIVAMVHGFKQLEHLRLGHQVIDDEPKGRYNSKEVFDD